MMLGQPRVWVLGGVSVLAFALATVTRADADLWGHLRFGLDVLSTHRLSLVDPYSFTQDKPWINHEWLSELQMAWAWSIAGSAGLALLKGTVLFGAMLCLWFSISGARVGLQVAIAILTVVGTIHMWAFMRPQLWTLLCFSILTRVLLSRDDRYGWVLPPMFVFWANCHGGWIVGLAVVAIWAMVSLALEAPDRWSWLVILFACAGATLVNPYGWRLWVFMVSTVGLTRPIAEWQGLWQAPVLNWLPWLVGMSGIVWIGLSGRDRFRWRPILVLAPLAYGALRVQRLESLFVVGSVILLGPWLSASSRRHSIPAGAVKGTAAAASLAAFVLASIVASASVRCIHVFPADAPDADAAGWLSTAQPGHLVTFFDWGEFAIWHFGPRLKVSIDGRRETVYSDARLAAQDAIVAGRPSGFATLAGWHAEYAWLPATSLKTKGWLLANGYRVDFDGPRSFVAVRSDLPVLHVQALSGPADCFPQ